MASLAYAVFLTALVAALPAALLTIDVAETDSLPECLVDRLVARLVESPAVVVAILPTVTACSTVYFAVDYYSTCCCHARYYPALHFAALPRANYS